MWLLHKRLKESRLQEDTGKLYRQTGQAKPSQGRVDWNNVTVTHIRISRISARHCCQDTLSLAPHTSYRQAQNLRSIATRAHDTKFLAREVTEVSCQVEYELKIFLRGMIKSMEFLAGQDIIQREKY